MPKVLTTKKDASVPYRSPEEVEAEIKKNREEGKKKFITTKEVDLKTYDNPNVPLEGGSGPLITSHNIEQFEGKPDLSGSTFDGRIEEEKKPVKKRKKRKRKTTTKKK